jgi:hypothetical protein
MTKVKDDNTPYTHVLQPGEHPILAGIAGSHAFGLAHAGSDIDRHGVYVMPTTTLLSLDAGTWERHTRTAHAPSDVTLHEAGKFARKALTCNPSMLDVLWLDQWEVITHEGAALVDIRDAFLSAPRVRASYLGYATSQFARLQRDGQFGNIPRARVEKHARHVVRLVEQGVRLWTTGTMMLRVNDPDQVFAWGRAIADDPTEAEAILDAAAHNMTGTSALPDQPDRECVEAWLQSVRRAHYTTTEATQ